MEAIFNILWLVNSLLIILCAWSLRFLFKVNLFWEREKAHVHESVEWGRDKERIPNRLCSVSAEAHAELEPTKRDHDLSHTATPRSISYRQRCFRVLTSVIHLLPSFFSFCLRYLEDVLLDTKQFRISFYHYIMTLFMFSNTFYH